MKPSHLILRLAAAVLSWLPFHATAYQQTPDCSFACGGSSQYSDCGSFAINFTPLYLQPNSSNLCYAAESVPLPLVSPHWKIHDIRPDYHFGFNVGIGYAIADNCSNMRLDWTHFHSKDSASMVVQEENMIGPFFEVGPDSSLYKKAKGHTKFQLDSVQFDYGVSFDLCCSLQTNLFVGINAARLKQTLFSKFSNMDNSIIRTINIPSTFTGAGPQIGADLSYNICPGLKLGAEAAAAFLVGSQRNHTNYSAISPALAILDASEPNDQSTHVKRRTQVVPALEAKLGLSYTYIFCNNVWLNLEAGYEVSLYINAIQSVDIGSEVLTPPVIPDTVGVYARTFRRTLSNFALSGPYLALQVRF